METMYNIVTMSNIHKKTVKSEAETKTFAHTSNEDLKEQFLAKKFRRSQSFPSKAINGQGMDKLIEFLRVKKNLDLAQMLHSIESEVIEPIDVLDDFYTFLDQYRKKNGTKLARGSIKLFITIAKEFLNSKGAKVYNEDVRQRLNLPQKDDIYEEGLTKGTIHRIIRASSLKLATVILIACSSSMRLGEILQLRLSDIDFDTEPTTIHIRKETTKTRQSRSTHVTTEASRAIKDYLAKTFGWMEGDKTDRYLFLQTHEEKIEKYKSQLKDPKTNKRRLQLLQRYIIDLEERLKKDSPEERYNHSVTTCKSSFENMLRKVIYSIPDLSVKIKDNNRNQIHFHAFRAWFKTQVTDAHQSDFAEALMGHKNLKTLYYRQNHQKREKTYRSIEPYLTIADTEIIEKNIKQLSENEMDLREQLKEVMQEMKTVKAFMQTVKSGYSEKSA